VSKQPPEHIIVAFRGEARRKGFAQVPNVVTLDHTISCSSYRLYALLVAYAMQSEGIIASQGAIAEDLHCTDRAVRKWLDDLAEHGLITIYRRGQMQPNIYVIEDAYDLYDQQKPKPSGRNGKHLSSEPSFRSSEESAFRSSGNGDSGQAGTAVPPLSKKQENNPEKTEEVLPSAGKRIGIERPEFIVSEGKGAVSEAIAWLRQREKFRK
jgi:hypothetical protein